MGPRFQPCQDCGGERLFEQPHEAPGSCPDAPDGLCPEWSCTECGATVLATVLTTVVPLPAKAAAMPAVAGRVA